MHGEADNFSPRNPVWRQHRPHPAGHAGRIAIRQTQGGVQRKAPGLAGGAVKIRTPQSDPAQAGQYHFGPGTVIFLVGLRRVFWSRQSGVVELFFQQPGAIVLEGGLQVAFGGGKVAHALSVKPVQAERGLRETGRQKGRNFFLCPGIAAPKSSVRSGRRNAGPAFGSGHRLRLRRQWFRPHRFRRAGNCFCRFPAVAKGSKGPG